MAQESGESEGQSVELPGEWRATHERLTQRPIEDLDGAELDTLADALFWLNDPRRSIEVRHRAFLRWQAERRTAQAVRSTWFLFYEHWLVGEVVVARGWIERARRLLAEFDPDRSSEIAGWHAIAEADVLLADGDAPGALSMAKGAAAIGAAIGNPDLVAMALQAEGRMLVATGEQAEGLARLDDAMVSVIANEVQPLYTGWIYCNVIATCRDAGDLKRANEWSVAALRWCRSLREGLLYPGLCRVYAAELALLRGDCTTAEEQARRASGDLIEYDKRYAGAAHYLIGEVCRLQGRIDEAEAAYGRAEALGHQPQPGLALLRVRQGHVDEALEVLQAAARSFERSGAVLPALDVATALLDVAEHAGSGEAWHTAMETLSRIGELADTSDMAMAYVRSAQGRATAGDDDAAAIDLLVTARDLFAALDMPLEVARQCLAVAGLAERNGDKATARFEREAAAAALDRMGVTVDALDTGAVVGPGADENEDEDGDEDQGAGSVPSPALAAIDDSTVDAVATLSERERQVLQLVATGMTNKEVADRLHLSSHTIARHLGNIFTKLGVRSRAGASAAAVAAGLHGPGR